MRHCYEVDNSQAAVLDIFLLCLPPKLSAFLQQEPYQRLCSLTDVLRSAVVGIVGCKLQNLPADHPIVESQEAKSGSEAGRVPNLTISARLPLEMGTKTHKDSEWVLLER